MTEEKITERDDGITRERVVEHSDTAPHTTIVERRGGGGIWVIAIILVIAVAIGAYFLINADAREAVETTAVTEAAGDVGDAAQQVGDAAQDAADAVGGN